MTLLLVALYVVMPLVTPRSLPEMSGYSAYEKLIVFMHTRVEGTAD
jgi:hypothetical protein